MSSLANMHEFRTQRALSQNQMDLGLCTNLLLFQIRNVLLYLFLYEIIYLWIKIINAISFQTFFKYNS